MKASELKYPGSKWLKHTVLLDETGVNEHLPETLRWSKEALFEMLSRHEILFLKPSLGGGGHGILKLMRFEDGYRVYTRQGSRGFRTKEQLFTALQRAVGTRPYLVQQGIRLLEIGRRPIDFRILVLKPRGRWTFMGIMAKVAARDRYVTNRCNGGAALRLSQALRDSAGCSERECREIEEDMKSFGLQAAEALNRHLPNISELGFDVGISEDRHIWLIEANTRPLFELFRHHPDPRLYRRIRSTIATLRKAKAGFGGQEAKL